MQHLLLDLGGGALDSTERSDGGIIIYSSSGDASGCGRTALAHGLCHLTSKWPLIAHIQVIHCLSVRGILV